MKKLYPGLYLWLGLYILTSLWLINFIECFSLIDSESLTKIAALYIENETSGTREVKSIPDSLTRGLSFFRSRQEADQYKKKNDGLIPATLLGFSSNDKKDAFYIVVDNPLVRETRRRYPFLSHLISPLFSISVFILAVFLWLGPLYRYSFFPDRLAELKTITRRITDLPLFIHVVSVLLAGFLLALKFWTYRTIFGSLPVSVLFLYTLSSVIFVTFLAIGVVGGLQKYIQDKIAAPFFRDTNPYGQKSGFSISLTMRVGLTIFLLGLMPVFLLIYLPVSFNSYLITSEVTRMAILKNINYAIPFILSIVLGVWFIIAQVMSIFTFRKSIQGPINSLIGRMERVGKGDFDCRTVVLNNDEIGKLKANFNAMLDGLVEREQIKDTFGKFVSFEIAEKLMNSGTLKLSGELINATILFSDIRDFTPLSEQMDPNSLINFLNHYFSYMVQPILDHGGVVNKFIGDAIMAIFTPAFSSEDPSNSALKAALSMRDALAKFNGLGVYPAIGTGIGIHCGNLVAGNVGTHNRMEYTVIGDNVNIAARIESQTKLFQTDLLISENVRQQIEDGCFPGIDFIPCPSVKLKGKSQPILLFKVEKHSEGGLERSQ